MALPERSSARALFFDVISALQRPRFFFCFFFVLRFNRLLTIKEALSVHNSVSNFFFVLRRKTEILTTSSFFFLERGMVGCEEQGDRDGFAFL